jgi:hypothetical protein
MLTLFACKKAYTRYNNGNNEDFLSLTIKLLAQSGHLHQAAGRTGE